MTVVWLQDIYAAMIAGLGISGSDGHADDLAELTNFSTQGDASWPVQLSPVSWLVLL